MKPALAQLDLANLPDSENTNQTAQQILDAALANLAMRARIILCGGISSYNDTSDARSPGLLNYMNITVMRATMTGFIVLDYAPRFAEGVQALATMMAQGKLKTIEDVQHGFENCPATLRRLFEGKNVGKQLLQLTELPLPRV